jgi:hypothetical protein
MQLISEGQVSLSNEAQASGSGSRPTTKKEKTYLCSSSWRGTACRQQTMTLTEEQQRALLGAAMVSVVGEELQTQPTRSTRVNVRSNSRRFSPDWLHNTTYSLVVANKHREQQVAYLQYLHSSHLTARPCRRPNRHLSNSFLQKIPTVVLVRTNATNVTNTCRPFYLRIKCMFVLLCSYLTCQANEDGGRYSVGLEGSLALFIFGNFTILNTYSREQGAFLRSWLVCS